MSGNVVITGASSGIGKSLAYLLAEKGMPLLLVSRSEEKLAAICKELTQKFDVAADYLSLDLTKSEEVAQLAKHIKTQSQPLRILINNAGFGLAGAFSESNHAQVTEMLQLNMLALTDLSRAAVDKMTQQLTEKQSIINIASIAGLMPTANMAAYGATKAYVVSFSRALGFECKDKNIQVLTVCPGPVKTAFADVAGIKSPMFEKFAQTPEDLSKTIWNAYQKNKKFIIPGWNNRLTMFISKFLPFSVTAAAGQKMLK